MCLKCCIVTLKGVNNYGGKMEYITAIILFLLIWAFVVVIIINAYIYLKRL